MRRSEVGQPDGAAMTTQQWQGRRRHGLALPRLLRATWGTAAVMVPVPVPVLVPVLALLLGLAGCPRHLRLERPYAAPTAAELGATLTERQKAMSSMNARARVTSWMGGDRVRATVLMLVDRPGRLRIEAEVSLQGTVAVLATDGQRFAFLDAVKNEMRRGPACPANVASLIRIPLGPADVAAVLLGDARLPLTATAGREIAVDWDPKREADVLAVPRNDGWLRYLFQRGAGEPRSTRLIAVDATGPDGRARWRVAFEDLADTDIPGTVVGRSATRIALPGTIRFAEGDTPFDEGVEIKFKDRAVNEPVADASFMLAPPPGVVPIEVGCAP